MASLTRCPSCDTFVKAESIDEGSCPFCPTASTASRRNPIPGVMLAAAMAAMPGCSDEEVKPALDASVDAAPRPVCAVESPPELVT